MYINQGNDFFTKEELDTRLEFLKETVFELGILISNNKDAISLEKQYKKDEKYKKIRIIHPFLRHYELLCYLVCTSNLCKIFLEREKSSFSKLFNKLKNDCYSNEVKSLLQDNIEKNKIGGTKCFTSKNDIKISIQGLENKINDNIELIFKIKKRRDKIYGHYDFKYAKPETLKEIEHLKNVAKEIFKTLYSGFYDCHYTFEPPTNELSITQIMEITKEWYDFKKQSITTTKNEIQTIQKSNYFISRRNYFSWEIYWDRRHVNR